LFIRQWPFNQSCDAGGRNPSIIFGFFWVCFYYCFECFRWGERFVSNRIDTVPAEFVFKLVNLSPPSPNPLPQGEGFHVLRAFEKSGNRIGRTAVLANEQHRLLSPSLGEGQSEGARHIKSSWLSPRHRQAHNIAPLADVLVVPAVDALVDAVAF
jgi:hypothetical protein